MRQRWGVLGLMLMVLTSGCFSQDGPASQSTEDGGASATEPALQGVVVDAAIRPIAGALVRVLGTTANTTTGEAGQYAFAVLPFEQVLLVSAVLDGYESTTKQISLKRDEPARLDFALTRLPIEDPFVQVVPFSGFLPCQASVMAADETRSFDCSNGVDVRDRFDAQAEPNISSIVYEVFWEPNAPAANSLGARLELIDGSGAARLLAETLGTSPLRMQVAEATIAQQMPTGGSLRLTVFAEPNGDELEASVAFAAAFQQSFDAYASLFYFAVPDPTYTVA